MTSPSEPRLFEPVATIPGQLALDTDPAPADPRETVRYCKRARAVEHEACPEA